MSVGDMPYRRGQHALIAFALWFASVGSFAIDNPDAPDLLAQFQSRAQPFEARIGDAAGSVGKTVAAYADYERFLNFELTHSYVALQRQLNLAERAALTQSQARWLAYRDAEFRFIDRNWNVSRFGTSATLSRNGYRSAVTKERTMTLLMYLKNYGSVATGKQSSANR